MFRVLLIAAAALGLSACGVRDVRPASPGQSPPPAVVTPAPSSIVDKAAGAVARADAAIYRAWIAYQVIRNAADLVEPFLSAPRANRLRAIEATVEGAFARARATSDLAVQAAELARAATAARSLEGLVIDPD